MNFDLTIKEIDPPSDMRCDGCRNAPREWRRGGPGTDLAPTLFYRIEGLINKVLCEPCYLVTMHVLKLKRQGRESEIRWAIKKNSKNSKQYSKEQ
jgi:hypothetical protein